MKKPSPFLFRNISTEIQIKSRKGTHCPHCGQFSKQYLRPLSAHIARFLIRLYRAQQHHEHHYTTRELYPRDNKSSTDGVFARHWGLIEVVEDANASGAPIGSMRLTDKGRRFVLDVERVPQYALLYNCECLGLQGVQIGIKDALLTKFNYDELMKEV